MPVIEPPPTVPKKETVAVRLEVLVLEELRRYAAYVGTRNFPTLLPVVSKGFSRPMPAIKLGSRRIRIFVLKPGLPAAAAPCPMVMRLVQFHHLLPLSFLPSAMLRLVARLEVRDGWSCQRCFAAADQARGFAALGTSPLEG